MMPDGRPTALVVDDASINIEILNEVLADVCEVIFATDALRGMALALSEHPDVILLDVMMPDIDGYEMCRMLKSDPSTADIPVIFVSAREGEHDEAMAFALGAADYIVKPLNAPVVRARVRNQLERRRRAGGPAGLPSQMVFDRLLDVEWRRAKREGGSVALLIVEIVGALAEPDAEDRLGDLLAGLLRRPADVVARYGERRLACLLPGTDEAGTAALSAAIARAKDGGPALRIGVAVHHPATGGSAGEFVGRAMRTLAG